MTANYSKWKIKAIAAQRFFMWHYANRFLNNILVSEFPKSGGTWLCEMLADVMKLDFPRNSFAPLSPCILHGHYPYRKQFGKPIAMVRDGRDVMVSAYYHFLIKHELNPPFLIESWRDRLKFKDYEDIVSNLPRFIHVFFRDFKVGGKPLTWDMHIQSFLDQDNVLLVKYESLLTSPCVEMRKVLKYIHFYQYSQEQLTGIIDSHSFKKKTHRLPGKENTSSFRRKGIAGDWKNVFSQEACEVFDQKAGDTLVAMGYEESHNWY